MIHIDDASSLCEGYRRGIARAGGELIVMCHDDIRILSPDFAVARRSVWLEIGGWYDKSQTSDAAIYSRLAGERGARYVMAVLGEHW